MASTSKGAGKSHSQNRSRPQSQSKSNGGKTSPNSNRSGGAKGSGANGSTARKSGGQSSSSGSKSRTQAKGGQQRSGSGSSSRSQASRPGQQRGKGEGERGRGGAQGREQGQSGEQSSRGGTIRKAGSKVMGTVKEHPYTAAAAATAAVAGIGMLITRGLRANKGPGRGSESQQEGGQDTGDFENQEEGDEQQPEMSGEEGQGEDEGGEEDEGGSEEDDEDDQSGGEFSDSAEGSGEGGDDDDDDDDSESGGGSFAGRMMERVASIGRSSLSRVGRGARNGASALADEASTGYERGREAAQQGWQNHPLLMAAAALAAGATIGWILPATRQEDRLVGAASDKLTGRIKDTAKELWDQGRTVAGRVVQEAVETTTRELEREGLAPDRIGKKVKRVASHVRDAVANAVQE